MARNVVLDGMDVNHADSVVLNFGSLRTGPRPMMPYNFNRSNNAGCVAVDYDAEDIVLTFNSNRTTPAGPRPIAQHVQNVIGENHADDTVVNFR